MNPIKSLPLEQDIETKAVLKKLAKAHQALAELKGVVAGIPNQTILTNTLSLQEAKDSSAIENIITTHDDLYRSDSITGIVALMQRHKHSLREQLPKIYSQDLINNLFRHPYTKIEFVMAELQITRQTAARYLDEVVALGLLSKHKLGKENYYLNNDLFMLLANVNAPQDVQS